MGTIQTEYLFSPGIHLPHVLLAMKFIRECEEDKQMCATKTKEDETSIHYKISHKMPDIMRVLFKTPSIDMKEVVDVSNANDKITSFICPSDALSNVTFETMTKYSKVGNHPDKKIKYTDPNQILVETSIKLKVPFNIPEAVKPLIEMWAKNKTRKIRKLESKYARMSMQSIKKQTSST